MDRVDFEKSQQTTKIVINYPACKEEMPIVSAGCVIRMQILCFSLAGQTQILSYPVSLVIAVIFGASRENCFRFCTSVG